MTTRTLFFFFSTFVIIQLSVSAFKLSDVKQKNIIQDEDPGEPLILTPYLEQGKIDEARNLSKVPDEYFLGIETYSGYFTVNKTYDSNMFFWFVPASNVDYKKAPVLLWLQGGPGGTSIFGMFNENGPVQLINGSLSLRDTAWTLDHSVLYIDNPVDTGYSFTNGRWCTTEEEVGEDLYTALIQFFQLFPELQQNEFFVTGESYGGKYVPAISYTIHKKNPDADLKINLKGFSIGDGLCDPINQNVWGEFLYQTGLIDDQARQNFNQMEQQYADLIEKEQYLDAVSVYQALFGIPSLFINDTGFVNEYNILKPLPDLNEEYLDYIQSNIIRKAIHVGNTTFDEHSMKVFEYLMADVPKSVAPWISELLSHYRGLFYSGQLDIIVPAPGTDNFLRKLNFSSATEFNKTERKQWKINDKIAGYVKSAGNLTQVIVRNAGHMVPADQPALAFDMITKFIKDIPL